MTVKNNKQNNEKVHPMPTKTQKQTQTTANRQQFGYIESQRALEAAVAEHKRLNADTNAAEEKPRASVFEQPNAAALREYLAQGAIVHYQQKYITVESAFIERETLKAYEIAVTFGDNLRYRVWLPKSQVKTKIVDWSNGLQQGLKRLEIGIAERSVRQLEDAHNDEHHAGRPQDHVQMS